MSFADRAGALPARLNISSTANHNTMFTELSLPLSRGRLRRPCDEDLHDLVRHANNPNLIQWLVDAFPHPYTETHGRAFLKRVVEDRSEEVFAIEIAGKLAGEIGLRPGQHERRFVCGIGYWLAEEFWGHGIMTEAVRVTTDHLLGDLGFVRIETDVYEPNVGSQRVLLKAGFQLESRRRKAVVKHGTIYDCLHFAKLRD